MVKWLWGQNDILKRKQAIAANGCALLRYAMITPVEKLTQVIKSNTAGFLRTGTEKY